MTARAVLKLYRKMLSTALVIADAQVRLLDERDQLARAALQREVDYLIILLPMLQATASFLDAVYVDLLDEAASSVARDVGGERTRSLHQAPDP